MKEHALGDPAGRLGACDDAILLAVDGRVAMPQAFRRALAGRGRLVRIDPGADGLGQVLAAARAAPGRRLVLVGHGGPGVLWLGDRPLTVAALRRSRLGLAAIGAAIAAVPVEIYACGLAAGAAGRDFLAALELGLGRPVAAATAPLLGRGGGWRLDAGTLPALPALDARRLADYPHNLANTDAATAGALDTALAGAANSDTVTLTTNALDYAIAAASVNSITLLMGGGVTSATISGGPIGSGAATTTLTFQPNSGQALTVSAQLTDNGQTFGIVKDGGGTLTLTSVATNYTGGTTVSGGTLSIASDSNIGTGAVQLNGGTLEVTGATTIDNGFVLGASNGTISATANVTVSGVIAGTGSLTKAGAATLLLNQTNTYNGGTTVSAGTLQLAGGTALHDSGAVTVNGGTLDLDNTSETIGTLSGSGGVIALGSGTLTVNQGANGAYAGNITGTGGLVKNGSATTLTLSGTNTYTGGTSIAAGTVAVSGGAALADTGSVTVAATAILDLGGSSETIGALSGAGTVTLGAGTLTVNQAANGSFTGAISGTGGLTKAGGGTLTLTATSSYSGATAINAGTLAVDGALTGGGTVSVNSGGTLGGTGSITGAVAVASGGTLSPGNSAGQISTGSLTLSSGATASFEINGTTAGTQYDQVVVTGTVSLGSATLSTSFGYTSSLGQSFVLISNDGSDAVVGTFNGLAEGAFFSAGGRTYQITYAGGSNNNDVVLTDAIPGSSTSGPATVGSDSQDLLVGTANAEVFQAGRGNDRVEAGDGADIIYGNAGDDSLLGQAGADTLYGGQDNDLVYGNTGGDLLQGNNGADTLYGGQGDDLVYGNQHADILHGNDGADTLYGGQGADTMFGGDGGDLLHGGAGNDLLSGGAGADRLVFASAAGADSIAGFSFAEGDVIAVAAGVNGTTIATPADLLARLSADAAGNAVIDLGGSSITLIGTPPGAVASDWLLVT
ncbi:MAG: hypothetical protein OHK0024_09260 [Thalassobaculales bacterium]